MRRSLGREGEAPEEEDEDLEDPGGPEDDVEMGFFDHLGELRMRLVRALLGVVPGMAIGWLYKEELLDILTAPLITAWHQLGLGEPQLHFANPIDPFVGYLKLAAVAGLLISSPWVFYQLWAFISPGLYRREKALAIPFVLASTLFFAGGAVFGYLVVFPMAFETLLDFAGLLPSESLRIEPTIMFTEYLGFATRMLLAFGVTFEVPVIVTFLSLAGVVNWRQLLRFARWWLLISGFVAALLTPPDVGSQMMMLVPLNVLYWVSIGLAWAFGPKVPKGGVTEDGFER